MKKRIRFKKNRKVSKIFCFRTKLSGSMMFIINVPAFMRYADSLFDFYFATFNK